MIDDVRQHPITPLPAEERADLRLGARQVKVGKTQCDQRGIPIPLVGILMRSRLGEYAGVVGAQDSNGAIN